ncbi:12827_t:CDS:2, partial [Ambispora leptoticha]
SRDILEQDPLPKQTNLTPPHESDSSDTDEEENMDPVMDAIHNLTSRFDKLAINMVQQQPEPQPKPAYTAKRESSITEGETITIIEETTTAIVTIEETEIEANLTIEIIGTKVNLMTKIIGTDPEKEVKKDEDQGLIVHHFPTIEITALTTYITETNWENTKPQPINTITP